MKKYTQFNYNVIVKVSIGILILNIFLVTLLVIQNAMFYKVNFSGNINQNITQTVNVNQKEDIEKININDCSFEALDSLRGIGEVKANRIINSRPYKDIYELRKVIGDTTFNNAKKYITV